MGIDASGEAFLRHARAAGADFRRTLTIGRQQLYGTGRGYAEPLLQELGATHIDSLDASDYEGATLIADLNEPLPAPWEGGYTVVYDGGTLEHVFDVPAALRNLMSLVAPGGHLIAGYPTNNQVGHGLYQFSPELFHRTLTAANGFVVELSLVAERSWWTRRPLRWWTARDALDAGRRVELGSRRPAELFILARRTGDVPAVLSPPQQSDYERAWAQPQRSRLADRVDALPWPLPAIVAEVLRRRYRRVGFPRVPAP